MSVSESSDMDMGDSPFNYFKNSLAHGRCGDQVEHVGDNSRGWAIGDDIAVIVAVLISRWWRGYAGVVRLGDDLETIVVRNPLAAYEVGARLRTPLPAADVAAIVSCEMPAVLIAEVKIIVIAIVSVVPVVPVVPMVAVVVVVVVPGISSGG